MFTSNVGQIALGVAAAVGIVAVAVVLTPPDRVEPEAEPTAVETASGAVTVTENPAPSVVLAQPEAQPVAAMAPVVDTLRVEADGEVLIAGRSEPLADVAVLVSGQEVGRTTADANGGFVAFADLAPSAQTRAIVLVADPDGAAVPSEQSYFIAPVADPASAVAVLDTPSTEQPLDLDTTIAPDVAVVEPQIEPATPDDTHQSASVEPAVPAAPAVIMVDTDGVKVVQSAGAAPLVLDNVALDSITYDPTGEVLIAGRAAGDGFVTVYLDNKPVTTSRITQSGDWRTDLPDIDTGVYTLRVDQVDVQGAVVSRIETPFKREEPAVVAEVLADQTADPDFEVAMATVQPGATLWAIAEDRFGDGIRYVEVFEANRDLIKNPDLIYPGQVFRVPQADQ